MIQSRISRHRCFILFYRKQRTLRSWINRDCTSNHKIFLIHDDLVEWCNQSLQKALIFNFAKFIPIFLSLEINFDLELFLILKFTSRYISYVYSIIWSNDPIQALQKSSTFRTSLVLSLEINHDLELIVLYPIEIHFKPSIHNLANDPELPRNYQCLLNFTKPSLIFFKSTTISNRSYFWNSLQANLASEKSLIFNQTSFLEINEHHDLESILLYWIRSPKIIDNSSTIQTLPFALDLESSRNIFLDNLILHLEPPKKTIDSFWRFFLQLQHLSKHKRKPANLFTLPNFNLPIKIL